MLVLPVHVLRQVQRTAATPPREAPPSRGAGPLLGVLSDGVGLASGAACCGEAAPRSRGARALREALRGPLILLQGGLLSFRPAATAAYPVIADVLAELQRRILVLHGVHHYERRVLVGLAGSSGVRAKQVLHCRLEDAGLLVGPPARGNRVSTAERLGLLIQARLRNLGCRDQRLLARQCQVVTHVPVVDLLGRCCSAIITSESRVTARPCPRPEHRGLHQALRSAVRLVIGRGELVGPRPGGIQAVHAFWTRIVVPLQALLAGVLRCAAAGPEGQR
mmetsp:Transcript_85420/g.236713  ORF Transcript_85420/g.236713 Transcript_85420/m.236713 type:complete len:278 (+) Transcript_85420:417-1250(+)